MPQHDCVVLYNTASMSEPTWSQETIYVTSAPRGDTSAVEESLLEAGHRPRLISVDYFSHDLARELSRSAPKFVFNLCEEINRDCRQEMCVAALMDLLAIPYTGSGPLALGLSLDKFRLKQTLRGAGIRVPDGYLHCRGRKSAPRSLGFPVIVKPVHEDASLGINSRSVCRDQAALKRQVAYVHEVYDQDALVEQYIDGREFNVALMGNGEVEVFPVSEIDFSGLPAGEPKIVSYRAKWDEDSLLFQGTVPVCPADISKKLERLLKKIALRSYRCVGCRDYARVDLRTDAQGEVYVLEVNPNPDISPEAGFPRSARAAGYTYTAMVVQITQCAMERAAQTAPTAYACS